MKMELWPEGAPYALGNEDEDRPDLTPFVLSGVAGPTACIIVPHEGNPVAEWLNSIGISAFVLKYRVAPNRHPSPLTDAQRAIRYVRSHAEELGIDPGRIGILGFSAGGHLAASAGTHYDAGNPDAADPIDRVSCRPDLMVLCYPVISFYEFRHQGSLNNLLGKDAPEELIRLMSNELQVTEDTPPAFLWHTTDDAGVPVENSLLFAAAMRKHRIPCELHSFETGRHGLGLAAEHPQAFAWTGLCERWLRLRGF
ncbi:MAG: esterase/lipase-like protein [Paenibacillaceae bacterium]|nr:esterase/lipase-like protein [Paenibacillaceae bacterium]